MSLTHSIPEVGEMGSADAVPAKTQMMHITAGAATTNDVVLTDCGAYVLVSTADLSTDDTLIIKHIWTQVETAFTASVDLSIGDTGSATLFNDVGTVAATATGAVLVADTAMASVPYIYQGSFKDIILDLNNATVAAGLVNIYIDYVLLRD